MTTEIESGIGTEREDPIAAPGARGSRIIPATGLDVLAAVKLLAAHGGRIRRESWPEGDFVTAPEPAPVGSYSYSSYFTLTSSDMSWTVRATPTVADMLATDWQWQPKA
jgi:hypothetical protein